MVSYRCLLLKYSQYSLLKTHDYLPMSNKAFFLDRDGTLNVDYDYVHKIEEWTWCDGAIQALELIRDMGYKILVVTNQSGVARGRYDMDDVKRLHQWVDDQLAKHDVKITEWYVAPWHPEFHGDRDPELLNYRKPGLGYFEEAREQYHLDLSQSCMAGDKVSDLQPAVELEITPFFIRSRHEESQDHQWLNQHKIETYDRLLDAVMTLQKENVS